MTLINKVSNLKNVYYFFLFLLFDKKRIKSFYCVSQMEIDEKNVKGEGFKPYYITKIEELQLIVAEKSQNLRRLQAQRNELNAKGNPTFLAHKRH